MRIRTILASGAVGAVALAGIAAAPASAVTHHAPTGLTATASDGTLDVEWTSIPDDSAFTRYTVSATSGGTTLTDHEAYINAASDAFPLGNFEAGSTVTVTVTAEFSDTLTTSATTTQTVPEPDADAPSDVSATEDSSGVQVAWAAPAPSESGPLVTGYTVHMIDADSSHNTDGTDVYDQSTVDGTTTSLTIPLAKAELGGPAQFVVEADFSDSTTTSSYPFQYTAPAIAPVTPTAKLKVTIFDGAADGVNVPEAEAILAKPYKWNAYSSNGVTARTIRFWLNGTRIGSAQVAGNDFSDTDDSVFVSHTMLKGDVLTAQETMTNSAGTSAGGPIARFVVPTLRPGVPHAKLHYGTNKVTLSWPAASRRGGSAITHYSVTVMLQNTKVGSASMSASHTRELVVKLPKRAWSNEYISVTLTTTNASKTTSTDYQYFLTSSSTKGVISGHELVQGG